MSERHLVKRALVVDYSPEVIRLIRAVLEVMNGVVHVDSTTKGDIAANLLDRNDYDIIILEAVVPYGDERLLRHISRSQPSICARMIVITPPPVEGAVRSDIERAKPLAMLEKPFDIVALSEAIRCAIMSSPRHGDPCALALIT